MDEVHVPVESASLYTDDVMLNAPPGLGSQLRQEFIINTTGGVVRHQSGPSQNNSLDSTASTHDALYQGNIFEFGGASKDVDNIPKLTWKSVEDNNSSPSKMGKFPGSFDSYIKINEDGTDSIDLPGTFLKNARKKWESSCIGHFVGGSFSFKFVKGKTMRLWSNLGLKNVFYSSKGYFTFKFGTVYEMDKILALKSVVIGGKRLYLASWIDGSQFQRNVIKNVSTWIKLVDVPHSYWSWEGLGNIAKVIGKPLSLDKQTAALNPMKFAGVLVELNYSRSYPKVIWVPVINDEDGTIMKKTVDIEYSAIPQSCCFCKAFGHPTACCGKNLQVSPPHHDVAQPQHNIPINLLIPYQKAVHSKANSESNAHLMEDPAHVVDIIPIQSSTSCVRSVYVCRRGVEYKPRSFLEFISF